MIDGRPVTYEESQFKGQGRTGFCLGSTVMLHINSFESRPSVCDWNILTVALSLAGLTPTIFERRRNKSNYSEVEIRHLRNS